MHNDLWRLCPGKGMTQELNRLANALVALALAADVP